ncbi:MAG: hypothetical protein HC913_17495 [Microscillaceae bacterium]|nr:hypothetical protein [Microscillaceae bacterium]
MEVRKIIAFKIVTWFCLFGTSCSDDLGPGANYLSFELDGQFWESNTADATGSFIGSSLISITLTARNPQGETLQLSIFSTEVDLIEYVFSPTVGIAFSPSGNLSGPDSFRSSSCALVSGGILLTEKEINFLSGTFSGSICLASGEQKQIRNGVFSQVRY